MATLGSLRVPLFCAFVLVVAAGPASVVTATGQGGVITVGHSGDADVASIQAAVDAASAGDTIRVEPGVYREQVTLDVAVAVVAPRGARLNGSAFAGSSVGFEIRTDGDTLVEGFTITDFSVGINGDGTSGNWVVRNTTVRNASWIAVSAGGTTGDWRLGNVTLVDIGTGIYARSSEGGWRVADATVRNVTEGHGVDALAATGGWTLDNVTVRDVDYAGVLAAHTEGDWRVLNSSVSGATVGVGATGATGNWTVNGSSITDSSVSDRYDFWQPRLTEGVGIDASRTTGSWDVHHTRFANVEEAAIVAEGANPAGNATENRWDETVSQDCVGNVSCSRTAATDQSHTPDTPTAPDAPNETSPTPVTSTQSPTPQVQSDDIQPPQSDSQSRVPGWSPRLGVVVGFVIAIGLISRRWQ